jgi:alpha-N-acetylglucosaminidase
LPLTHGRESFRANGFYSQLADWEINWVKTKRRFDQQQKKDEWNIVNELMKKYAKGIE